MVSSWMSILSICKTVALLFAILSVRSCRGNANDSTRENETFHCNDIVYDGLNENYLKCNFGVLFQSGNINFECFKNSNISGIGVSIFDEWENPNLDEILFTGSLTCTSSVPITIKAEFANGVANALLAQVRQNRITNFTSGGVNYEYHITVDFPEIDFVANFKRPTLVKYVVSTIESPHLHQSVLIDFFRPLLGRGGSRHPLGICSRQIYSLLGADGIEVNVQETVEIPIVSVKENFFFLQRNICRGTFSNQCDEPDGKLPCFPSTNYSDIKDTLSTLFTENKSVPLNILLDYLKIKNDKIKIVDYGNLSAEKGEPVLQTDQRKTERFIVVQNKILEYDDVYEVVRAVKSLENNYCESQNLTKYTEVLYLLQLLDVGEVIIGEPGDIHLNAWKGFQVRTNFLEKFGSGIYSIIPEQCNNFSIPIQFKDFAARPQELELYPKFVFHNTLTGKTESDVEFQLQCSSTYELVINQGWSRGDILLNQSFSNVELLNTFHKYKSTALMTVAQTTKRIGSEVFTCQKRGMDMNKPKNWIITLKDYPIQYSQKHKLFHCSSDFSGRLMAIKQWKCRNRLQCQIIAESCLNTNNTTALNGKSNAIENPACMQSLSDINMKSCQSVGISNPLVDVCFAAEPLKNGILHCSASWGVQLIFSVHVVYFTGLDGKLYVENEMKGPPPKDAVLKLSKLNDQQIFYVKEKYAFRCEAHSFFYESGIQWFIEFANGTVIPLQQYNSEKNSENEKVVDGIQENLSEVKFVVNDLSLKKITCSAPVFGTTLWDFTSLELTVLESTAPKIISPDSNVNLINNGKGQSITCQATGGPLPTILWRTENGSAIEEPLQILDNNTLHFPIYNETFSGNYVCTASNVAGKDIKKIHVNGIPQSEEENTKTLLIATITPIASVFCSALLIFLYLRKRQIERYHELKKIIAKLDGLTNEDDEDPINLPFQKKYEMKKTSFLIDRTKPLGVGNFGIVYKGLMDAVDGAVAFKTNREPTIVEHLNALVSEIKILMYIGPHENLITLLGVYKKDINNGVLIAALDYCKLGSLDDFLRKNKQLFSESLKQELLNIKCVSSEYVAENPNKRLCSTKSIIKWLGQIASAMEYLETKKVVHSDLAARNVLLTAQEDVKVSDLGLSRRTYNYTEYIKKGKDGLPWRWLAAESLKANTFSSKSDVWSYGILMWEMYSLGDIPYPGMDFTLDFVTELTTRELRNTKPQFANDEVYNLMRKCWHIDPDERPTFSELKAVFQQNVLNGKISIEVFINALPKCSSSTAPPVYMTIEELENYV